jgi:hypothetical protein
VILRTPSWEKKKKQSGNGGDGKEN